MKPRPPQLSPMDAEITDVDPVQDSRAKLRVEIPPNYISTLVVPVMSPPPSADELKDLPHTVRGIRDSVDVCTSEIRQLKTRLDRREVTCEHPLGAEPKSPEVVELEMELDETKSTLQDIRMRGQSLQTRNDVLARQAERVKSACGLLLEGHYDEASWKGVFYESSSLLQSHPLSRLRIRLAQFTSQLTSALKGFQDDGTWTPVTTGGLGSGFQGICDLLNDLMGQAEAQYLPPAKSRTRSHSVPVATGNGYPTRPPVRPKPSSLRSLTKVSSPSDESKHAR